MDERRWFYVFFVTIEDDAEKCVTLHCKKREIEDRLKKLIQVCNPGNQLIGIDDWIEIPSSVTVDWDDEDELDETLAYNYMN